MIPETLCRLLAEPVRLRTYAAVALGAGTPSEVADRAGLVARETIRALGQLETGGLVSTVEGRLVADLDAFKVAVRESLADGTEAESEPLDPDRERAAVLRVFIRDGRLVSIPAVRRKRRVVLEHLASCFEPGVKYPERAVDAVLRAWHADYASLRRFLVDEDLMMRERGLYWRTGGFVEV